MFRNKPQQSEQNIVFDDGQLSVDVAEHVVTFAQEEIVLTKKEFQLLALLIRHQGKIVTQKQIMTELWGISHEEDTHYLRILVKKLRTKIGDSAVTPKYIFTIAGVGLRFDAANHT